MIVYCSKVEAFIKEGVDIIVSSGGVSMGEKDFIQTLLAGTVILFEHSNFLFGC